MSNKAASTLGQVTESDLLAWADKQTLSGAFGVNPATTTQGVPVVGWYHGFLEVKASGRRITLTESAGQYRTWTNCTSGGEWTKWVRQTTATPPQEYDLPLVAGATSVGVGYKNAYSKDQFGIVRVWFSIHFDILPALNSSVFTLPAGFRPNSICYGSAVLSMGEHYCTTIYIAPDGTARVNHGTIAQAGAINLHGFIEFPAVN